MKAGLGLGWTSDVLIANLTSREVPGSTGRSIVAIAISWRGASWKVKAIVRNHAETL